MLLSKTPNNKIDVVIPYHTKDSDIIDLCLTGCANNIHNLANIYVITKNSDAARDGVELVNEDELFGDGLTKKYIESRLRIECPDYVWKSGWLFQQFIKMGCSYAIPNLTNRYLVVDADVVFLKKIPWLRNGRMFLTKTDEYHQPHFNCCEKLLGEPINRKHAFVAHHMLISKSIMLELLGNIEQRFGKKWYDAILDNIDDKKGSMLSEYELYGHYLENHYPEKVVIRRLRNIQRFKARCLLRLLLNMADYVTIHDYKKPRNNPKTNLQKYELFLCLVRNKLKRQRAKAMLTPTGVYDYSQQSELRGTSQLQENKP